MSNLRIDTTVPSLSDDTGAVARDAEQWGFDGVWTMENSNDGLLPHPLVAEETDTVRMGTRIALAFTRSPMIQAQMAWDLADYSDGRFVLGLGTQVKGHNERRFSVDWDSPGPRLREVVESIRHTWDVFQGNVDDLDYQGEFYSFSLISPRFNPDPIETPDILIYLASVNEYNLRLAGELADGLAVHPFTSRAYLAEVITEHLEAGAARGNRSADEVNILHSPLVITGRTTEEMAAERERVRRRIAFYGSTRTYHDVLETHDWKDVGDQLHELSKDQQWDEMTQLVTDEMLETLAIEARPGELVDTVRGTYCDLVDRIVLPPEHAARYDID